MVGHPQKPHRQGERGADIFSGKGWSISTGLWAVLRLISGMIRAAIPNYLALSTRSTRNQCFMSLSPHNNSIKRLLCSPHFTNEETEARRD